MALSKFLRNISILCMLVTASCGVKSSNDVLTVSVSVPPEEFVLKEIGGDKIDVKCLMTKGSNPESFEPTVNQILELSKSDLYFTIGLLDFEYGLKDKVKENSKDIEVINFADSLELLYGTHGDCGHHHEHHYHGVSDADPHVWASIKNLKKMGQTAYYVLCKYDAQNKGTYKANLDKYTHRLDSIDDIISGKISRLRTKSFLVWHPSLSYFANDYGLTQITIGSHNKEQSISRLKEKIVQAMQDSVRVFFYQKEFDSSQATVANEKIDARFVEINSMNEDVTGELIHIANELSK